MAVVRIPTTSASSSFQQTTDIDGTLYRLTFNYNTRDSSWYVTWATQGGVAIVAGRKLRIDETLLFQFTDDRLPSTSTIAPDLDGTRAEPGRDDLGSRVQVLNG